MRTVCGEQAITQESGNLDFRKIVILNPTACLIWENFIGKEFTIESVADFLCDYFKIERDLALSDAKRFIDMIHQIGVIED